MAISAWIGAVAALAGLALFGAQGAHAQEAPPYQIAGSAVHELAGPKGRVYALYVKTPPGYDRPENAGRRYPVMIVNDGDLFFAAAAGASLLPTFNARAREMIIVGVSYAKGEDPIASRQRDLTPTAASGFKNETGGAATYLDWLDDTAIAFVDAAYRTDGARRALAGHSLGGVFAAYVMFTRPALFSDYVIISPALWYDDHAVAGLEARYARVHDDLDARVFIAVGELEGPRGGLKAVDMVADAQGFALRLASRQYPDTEVETLVASGADHAASFSASIAQAMEWVFAE
ncbi:MAG: alpha/beta hydrolase-fold protein [Parvularculaceae bacterium]